MQTSREAEFGPATRTLQPGKKAVLGPFKGFQTPPHERGRAAPLTLPCISLIYQWIR